MKLLARLFRREPEPASPRRPLDHLTPRARRLLEQARLAIRRGGPKDAGPIHLLLGLLELRTGIGAEVLRHFRVDTSLIRRRLEAELLQETEPFGAQDTTLDGLLQRAAGEAEILGHGYLGTAHLLLALLRQEESRPGRLLREASVELEAARAAVRQALKSGSYQRLCVE